MQNYHNHFFFSKKVKTFSYFTDKTLLKYNKKYVSKTIKKEQNSCMSKYFF